MRRIPKTVMVSEENAKFLDSIPRGLKGTIIDALLLAMRKEFEGDPEKAVMWAFSFIKKSSTVSQEASDEALSLTLINSKLVKSEQEV